MSSSLRVRMASAAGAVVLLVGIAGIVLEVLDGPRGWQHGFGGPGPWLIAGVGIASTGVVVALRRPRNPVGWLFVGAGAALTVALTAQQYAIHAVYVAPGSLPAPLLASWLGTWTFNAMVPLLTVFLPLLFPNGELPSNRLRIAVWIMIGVSTLFVVFAAIPPINIATRVDPDGTLYGAQMSESGSGPIHRLTTILLLATMLSALVAVASLVVRFVRSRGDEREQLKWLLFAAALMVVALVLSAFTASAPTTSPLHDIVPPLFLLAILGLPVATGIAILRYRLYDIDVVISRTLVYGALAAFITAVYVGIVVGVGTLVGSGGQPNLVLSIVATAVVALAFQPLRERLQKIANRLVYGRRATPYEVLSDFSQRVAETYAADEALPRMAMVLAEGTGAGRATVWLRSGAQLKPAATWPPREATHGTAPLDPAQSLTFTGESVPDVPGVDKVVPVRHLDELLGALTVTKRRGESLTPVEDKLLGDLASQAGLVLKNVGLTDELLERLEELRASRQRLVAAQDDERRRLERNLHDGAQQNLVALKVKLGLVEMLAGKDAGKARQLLAELKDDTDEALNTLRDLARGIYPPLLADRGLGAALEAQSRKATLAVEVVADGIGRYPQEVEAAVYFCVLEALQNTQKYAEASRALVRLSASDGTLTFEVEDDGKGFEPAMAKRGAGITNMGDRLEALGGCIELESEPGAGARLRGTIPALHPMPA